MRYTSHEQTSRKDELLSYRDTLKALVETKDTSAPEGALVMPFLEANDSEKALAALGSISNLFLVGIGGSSLGTDAVVSALKREGGEVALRIFDTVSAERIANTLHDLKKNNTPKEKIAIVVISKSGGTTETIANASMLLSALVSHYGTPLADRVLVITDEGSPVAAIAVKEKYLLFHLPKAIGGRYSVFTNVGVIPLALLGIDVESFLKGARDCITEELNNASPTTFQSAGVIANAQEHSVNVIDTFVFDSSLEQYGKWRRQLLAESLGKSANQNGVEGVYGPLPTVSTVADLHSIGQLYLSGFRGIHTDFITQSTYGNRAVETHPLTSVLPYLAGKTTDAIMKALEGSVLQSYKEQSLPYAEFTLSHKNAYELGSLMAHNMLETIYAAKLLGVDAFNQPNVELYKAIMRRELSGGK